MYRPRLLPWEYGIRNLFRRPVRSLLTLQAIAIVVLLILAVAGFIRGLNQTLAVSGDADVVLVYSLGAGENIENSAIEAGTGGLLAASLDCIHRRFDIPHASPELYLATRVAPGEGTRPMLGLVRGVTATAPLVRRQVRIVEGRWPTTGEVLAGRLAHAKLGSPAETLAVGKTILLEGRSWRVSGQFVAAHSALESELWCPLAELQQATKRQDLSLVALLLAPGASPGEVDMFCKERVDLELQATPETAYYASLERHYRPVRVIAWLVVGLVSGAGLFAGLNTMYGAVVGRVREMAMLQTTGFRRRAIVLSIIQEAVVLAATASLLAAIVALSLVNGAAVRFTMGAFTLKIDSTAILLGCAIGLGLGVIGAIPPAIRAMRMPVSEGLKAV
ncbi:MAG: ABC transporter permease [Thermoguttaceae bacterium]|nr:ABC transporter permease [Thermoguttaceae bacterium]